MQVDINDKLRELPPVFVLAGSVSGHDRTGIFISGEGAHQEVTTSYFCLS